MRVREECFPKFYMQSYHKYAVFLEFVELMYFTMVPSAKIGLQGPYRLIVLEQTGGMPQALGASVEMPSDHGLIIPYKI